MSNKINVLVFPCGAENAIEIHTALKDLVTVEVFGASGRDDHGRFVFRNYIGGLPFITDPSFETLFNEILEKHKIDVVIPTHDDVSLYFARNAENFKAKIAVPGLQQAEICRSKIATYALFGGEDFCPKVISSPEEAEVFPLFAKPDASQGGKGALIVHDRQRLESLDPGVNYVITEFLPGEEITVDCFSDRHYTLRFAGPRERKRVFSGISVNSFTLPLTDEIKHIAEKINEKLKLRGLWYFQLKKDVNGKFRLLEVSVRTAGTMNLYRGLGVNFPLLTVYDLMDYEVEILTNDYYLEVDRALFNRYRSSLEYDTVYVDFDDTITKGKQANPASMFFLYHERNKGKEIILITKHEHDLDETLATLAIHKGLFHQIIHLQAGDEKYKYIDKSKKAIFIDNAYKERVAVKKNLGIPVFDVDAMSTLIDWRE